LPALAAVCVTQGNTETQRLKPPFIRNRLRHD
jgi:hypothetical protein